MFRRIPLLLAPLLAMACGLADDPQDERDRYVYLTFFDKTFEACCLESFDLDGDGRISRYEARRVREIACPGLGIVSLTDLREFPCPGLGIVSLTDLREFPNLERLDCADNALTELDLSACTLLMRVDCGGNDLTVLGLDGLRGLTRLDCADNALAQLDLTANVSLAWLDARGNRFRTLDVSACSAALQADVRGNPDLGPLYCRASQGILFDGITTPVER